MLCVFDVINVIFFAVECKTGEVRLTRGHALPARYIIHTVGPKYNIKYQSASENTLHTCYRWVGCDTCVLTTIHRNSFVVGFWIEIVMLFCRNVLQKAKEMGLHSIALCVINSVKRNYPPDEGAHIALRKGYHKKDNLEICFMAKFSFPPI